MSNINKILEKLITLPEGFDIDKASDEDLGNLVNQINENFKLRLINTNETDNNWFSQLKNQIVEKKVNEVESSIKMKAKKAFMLDEKDVDNRDVEKIFEHVSTKINQSADIRLNEFQQKLQSANQKLEEYETRTIPSLKSQMESSVNEAKIDFNLRNYLSSFKNDLAVSKWELVYPAFKQSIESKYQINLDNMTNNIIIRTKNGAEVFDNTRQLTNQDIILKELKELDLLRKNNSNTEAVLEKNILKGVETIVNNSKSGNVNNSARKAAEQRLAELKK